MDAMERSRIPKGRELPRGRRDVFWSFRFKIKRLKWACESHRETEAKGEYRVRSVSRTVYIGLYIEA